MPRYSSLLVILVLWFAGLCAAAQFAKMALFLPELQQLYPDAGAAAGFLITLISLVGAVLGLVAGLLVGQMGARRVLLIGLAIGSLVSFIQVLSLPLGLLLLTRTIEGASHLAIVVAAPTLIAQFSSDRLRPTAMTLWGTFFGVSFALSAWLGLPLVAAKGIHALFLAHAVLMSAATMLTLWAVPLLPQTPERETNSKAFCLSALYDKHKQAWLSPYIAAPAAGWLFYTLTFVALLAVLPNLMPEGQRAFLASALPLASTASSMTIGVALLWRYTAIHIINIGFIMAICFALLILIAQETAIICILMFGALGIVQGASYAAIPELNTTASQQALSYGAIAQAGNIGNLCGTPLLLVLLNYGGTPLMLGAVVVCYLLAIYIHAVFSKRRQTNIAAV